MKQLLIELDDETAEKLERVAPARSRRRSQFVRTAIRRALWELEEQATAEAYRSQPRFWRGCLCRRTCMGSRAHRFGRSSSGELALWPLNNALLHHWARIAVIRDQIFKDHYDRLRKKRPRPRQSSQRRYGSHPCDRRRHAPRRNPLRPFSALNRKTTRQ